MVTSAKSRPILTLKERYQHACDLYHRHKKRLIIASIIICGALISYKPQQFVNLWLTADQQGQILFNIKDYDRAATQFTNARWQAYSFYGAEKFSQATLLYSQFNTADDMLSRANAMSHQRRYIQARNLYQDIITQYPHFTPAQTNLLIVQKIIDAVNLMSESQKAEDGDASKELGDEPQTGDGADKKEMRKQQTEIYSAEELLLDPELNAMWLRQVKKNPARFLAQKFNMQLKTSSGPATISGKKDKKND